MDSIGNDPKRDTTYATISQNSIAPPGFALIRNNSYGNSVRNVDTMFQFVCYASIILSLGLPVHSYLYGSSFSICILPAMLAAHVTSIGLVSPFLKVYHHGNTNHISKLHIGAMTYLRQRFGVTKYPYKEDGVKHMEMSGNSSSSDFSILILITLTYLLVLVLWALFTVC